MSDYRLSLAPDIAEIARLLDWVESCCDEAAVGHDTTLKLALALEEAVANVIHYAFGDIPPPHRVSIELAIDSHGITAEVIDNGRAFDPCTALEPDRDLPLEERRPGGFGIHLIRKMMDDVDYRRVDDENHLRLKKARA